MMLAWPPRVALLAAALFAAAPAHAADPDATDSHATAGTIHPEAWPRLRGGVLIRPRIERQVDDLLGRMSLEDKIGQMVQADFASITPEDLRRYRLGSILAGGLDGPRDDVLASAQAWRDMVAEYKRAALAPGTQGHAPIPLLFGIDAVHGHGKIPGATIFPHNVGLGAAHDPDLVRRIGEATAQEVAATGIDWAFAPTLAVVRDPRWGRAYESYSDDPSLVAAYAAAMVSGLQGAQGTPQQFAPGHVLASAKHFVGDGGTAGGRDQGDNLSSEAVLRDVHAAGYPAAIEAGVGSVMASYSSWHGTKMHVDAALLTDVLKGRWGFDGFVVGDWNALEELPGCTKFACADAVRAGIDMVMAPDSWREIYASLVSQVRAGTIPAARIDDAVRRILRVKGLLGLLDPTPRGGQKTPAGATSVDLSVLGSPAHRALAREAVRRSLVLLKNEDGMLPLDPRRRVLVVGEAADDIGQQCGGWTLDWQGARNTNEDLRGATSLYAGIRQAVRDAGGIASFSADGGFDERPDVAIVVYGETPYAEFEGDSENLLLAASGRTRAILRRLRAQGVPTVTVLLSGRPLWVAPEINLSRAYVAAWLPGSEGEGVADMLFRGRDGAMPDFSGRLGFPWPATAMPVAYDAHDQPVGAAFPRGYGLDLTHPAHVAGLPEDPHLPPEQAIPDRFFASGRVVAPWSITVSDPRAEVRLTQREQLSPGGAVATALDGQAVRVRWTGHGAGTWRIGGRPVDLAAQAAAGLALRLTYREAAPLALRLGMGCGAGCGTALDITAAMRPGTTGGWHTLAIPLACFGGRGVDLSHVDIPVSLQAETPGEITLLDVAIAPAPAALPCPAA